MRQVVALLLGAAIAIDTSALCWSGYGVKELQANGGFVSSKNIVLIFDPRHNPDPSSQYYVKPVEETIGDISVGSPEIVRGAIWPAMELSTFTWGQDHRITHDIKRARYIENSFYSSHRDRELWRSFGGDYCAPQIKNYCGNFTKVGNPIIYGQADISNPCLPRFERAVDRVDRLELKEHVGTLQSSKALLRNVGLSLGLNNGFLARSPGEEGKPSASDRSHSNEETQPYIVPPKALLFSAMALFVGLFCLQFGPELLWGVWYITVAASAAVWLMFVIEHTL